MKEDNIKRSLREVNCNNVIRIKQPEGRGQLQVLVKMAMNLRFPPTLNLWLKHTGSDKHNSLLFMVILGRFDTGRGRKTSERALSTGYSSNVKIQFRKVTV